MQYELTYHDATELCDEKMNAYKPENGTEAQNAMLWDIDEDSLEEAERLNVILALIKWEIENDKLTDELKDELYLYYQDYTKGNLANIIDDNESDSVINDLSECYNKVFE